MVDHVVHAEVREAQCAVVVVELERADARGVGLKRQHYNVVHCPQVLTQPLEFNISIKLRGNARLDLWSRQLEPRLSPLGTHLHLANGHQVLFEPTAIIIT